MVKQKIFRIIDANFNRSREGLRVCEDIARFALSSETQTRQLKIIRHTISSIAKEFELELGLLSASRDSGEDVGRASRITGGMTRKSLRDIFAANMERVKESIRVLEEFFKLVDPAVSARLSKLRFKAYDIEKAIVHKLESVRHSGRRTSGAAGIAPSSKRCRARRGPRNTVQG